MLKRQKWLIAALVAVTLAVVIGIAMWASVPAHGPNRVKVTSQQVMSVHQKLLTIDSHMDIPATWASDAFDAAHNPNYDFDLERMKQGGMKAGFFIVYVPQGPRTIAGNAEAVSEAFAKFAAIHRMTDERNANLIELARTADDVERISAAGKLVALIGVENGYALGHHLELLKMYYDLGARYLGLAYNGVNDLADGGMADGMNVGAQEPEFHGLSEFGKQVLAECNRLGIMVDVAHSSHEVQMQAAELSKAPIIDSHTGVDAVMNSPRNLDDDALRAIAKTGGVVQIFGWDSYIKAVPQEKLEALAGLRDQFKIGPGHFPSNFSDDERNRYLGALSAIDAKWPRASLKDLADHIDHAVKVIGVDHVGIASDFGAGQGVDGWREVSQTPNVTAELLSRGYTEADLAKMWGGNLLRVMRAVAKEAEKEQAKDR